MKKLFTIFIIAIVLNEAFGMSYRRKRQSNDEDENNLEDRYGWDRPGRLPQGRPNRPQNGGRQDWPFPGQSFDNRPNQQWGNQPGQQQWGGQPNGQQWDGSGSQPNQPWGNNGQQNPGQPTQTPGGATTQSSDTAACILRCPSTPEYNPVCGNNGVTYNNPGKLMCAQTCGVAVSLQRSSPCPTTTTAAPAS